MANIALNLLVLKTRQMERVRRFYQILGIVFTQEQHGKGPSHHAGQVGGVVIEIYPLPEDGSAVEVSTRLGFVIPDVAETVQTLQEAGTPIIRQPTVTAWGLQAVVKDPDGRTVELKEQEKDLQ